MLDLRTARAGQRLVPPDRRPTSGRRSASRSCRSRRRTCRSRSSRRRRRSCRSCRASKVSRPTATSSGTVKSDPATVEVVGPTGAVARLTEAITEPVSIAGATEPVTDMVNIGVADPSVRLREPGSAQVTVNIVGAPVEWAIAGIPIRRPEHGSRRNDARRRHGVRARSARDARDRGSRTSRRRSTSKGFGRACSSCRCASSRRPASASSRSSRRTCGSGFDSRRTQHGPVVWHGRGPRQGGPVSARRPRRSGGLARRSCARCGHGSPGVRFLAGRDTRESGEWIERELAAGIASQGGTLTSAGVIPTPAIAYLTPRMGYTAGVVISASHNPFDDNGIKVFSGTGEKFTEALERPGRVDHGRLVRGRGGPAGDASRRRTDRLPLGVHRAPAGDSSARRTRTGRMRIVVDCANGATTTVAPRLFKQLGFDARCIGCAAGRPQHQPATADRRRPELLARTVVEGGYRLGIAYDGDGDRAIFVDAAGRVVDGDAVMLMCAKQMKAEGRLKGNAARRDGDEQHRSGDRAARGRASTSSAAPWATST